MKISHKRSYISTAVLLGAITTPTTVFAEEETKDYQLETIVVTAERRSSTVQETPIAITAFDQAALDRTGIKDVSDISNLVPNLSFGQEAFSGGVGVSIRGVTSDNSTSVGDPAVAFHIDGIYVARPQGLNALLFDLERVEVLRGPQGTLSGRNSTAGSINIITSKPTEDFEATAEVLVGNYGRLTTKGMVNIPVTDDWAVRGTVYREVRDGYFDVTSPDISDSGDADDLGFRLSSLFKPTDEISWQLTVEDFTKDDAGGLATLLTGEPMGDIYDNRQLDFQGSFKLDITSIRSRINWDFSDTMQLSYLASKVKLDRSSTNDLDGQDRAFPSPRSNVGDFINSSSTHELQLKSTGDAPLSWVLGAFLFEEDNDTDFRFEVPGAGGFAFINPTKTSESWALFSQGTYEFSGDLRITAGLRYSEDEKQEKDGKTFQCLTTLDLKTCFPPETKNFKGAWDSTTWKVGADWNVDEDTLVYGSVATGYKAGGYSGNVGYDEENIINYEFGFKRTLLDNTMNVNTAVFYSIYDDLQVSQVKNSRSQTTNAGESSIQGLEVELQWAISADGRVDAFFAYLDAEYDKFENITDPGAVDPDAIIDLSGNKLVRAPEFSFNISYEHIFELSDGSLLIPNISYHWEDESYLRPHNTVFDKQESWGQTEISLTYESADGRFTIGAYVKNIEDNRVLTQVNALPFTGAIPGRDGLMGNYNAPRTFGARIAYMWD